MENEQDLTIKERREQKRLEKLKKRENQEIQGKKSRTILWISVIFIIIVIVGIIIGIVKNAPPPTPDNTPVAILDSITSSDWIRGNKNASTTLVEYGDFECPACGQYYPILKQIESEFKDNLKVVFRNFPLSQHVNARLAARAAEAAGNQGKFFEMHDMLYEHQEDWTGKSAAKSIFTEYAKSLSLDIGKFTKDFESKEIGVKIDDDVASGNFYGVNSTPTFYLGDTKISPRSFEEFKKLISNEISQKP